MKVEVKAHQEQWHQMFEKESQRLLCIFGEELLEIHHIGSTSVCGLKAKPIIDIMPVAKDIEKIDAFHEQMKVIGYEALGEFGIIGRRYLRKGGDHRTHHIHIFQENNKREIDRHLAVRDYLRTHEEDAISYGDLKTDLAKQFPNDIASYVRGKDTFVKNLERRALRWYKNRQVKK